MLEAIFIIALLYYFIRGYRNYLWRQEEKKAEKFLRRQQALEIRQIQQAQAARAARTNKGRRSKNED